MGAAARGTSSPLGVEAKWAFERIASRIGSVLDILTGSAAFHVLGERGSEDQDQTRVALVEPSGVHVPF